MLKNASSAKIFFFSRKSRDITDKKRKIMNNSLENSLCKSSSLMTETQDKTKVF